LQETLMTAHQVTEELKVNARKEAEIVVAEAHLEGERVIRDANERRIQLINEVQEIKRQRISFEGGLRALIENHLKLMDLDSLQLEEDDYQARLLQPLLSDDDIDDPLNFP
jgi:cell division initiation protein